MKAPLRYDFASFSTEAQAVCPDRVFTDFLHRYAYGVDASCFGIGESIWNTSYF